MLTWRALFWLNITISSRHTQRGLGTGHRVAADGDRFVLEYWLKPGLEASLRDPGWQANQRKATIPGDRLKPELQLQLLPE